MVGDTGVISPRNHSTSDITCDSWRYRGAVVTPSLVPVGSGKKRQLIQIPNDLALWVECCAEVNRRSQSAWILDLVWEYLEVQDQKEAAKVLALMEKKIAANPELAEHFENSDLLDGLREMAAD